MSETPSSSSPWIPNPDLKGFDTDDMKNLAVGIWQMTGLEDRDVASLMGVMPKKGLVKVLDISSPDLEKGTGLSRCIQVSFASGHSFKIGKMGQEGRYYMYEMSVLATVPDARLYIGLRGSDPGGSTQRNAAESNPTHFTIGLRGFDLDGGLRQDGDDWDD